MVSPNPAKFNGHTQWGSRDIMFLVAKEENSRSSKSSITVCF